jgi:mannose-6-phosphate isomerase-like protein (cupin superfamily)
MNDSKNLKTTASDARTGADGSIRLAAGKSVAMRMWRNEQPDAPKPSASRPYETVGYVISGRAELHCGDSVTELCAGDSWIVPSDVEHTYRILEPFSAIEATAPPAH